MKVIFKSVLVLALAVSLMVPMTAYGMSITFDLDYEFSGAQPPEGAPPWLTATFDDEGTAGSVELTMSASGLVENEYVKVWLFNLDPTLDPTLLTFTVDGSSGSIPTSISTGVDAFLADGDGNFDIEFDFPNPMAQRFAAGETVIVDIGSPESIVASSFDFLSASGGGAGLYETAAHVGGIDTPGTDDDNLSGWIGPGNGTPMPEPGIMFLLGIALIGLVGIKKWRNIL